MGYYMMKPDPDEDFYVEWSTYTDSPIAYGTREEFQDENKDTYSDDRFERIDRLGSSYMLDIGRWHQKSFWIGQSWEISRDKLKPFLLEAFEIKDFDYWSDNEECQAVVNKYCTPLVFDD